LRAFMHGGSDPPLAKGTQTAIGFLGRWGYKSVD
jgi:hypothetical protein